jgi:nicotinate-nucleotide pyrophosphorylase (carboxylating)
MQKMRIPQKKILPIIKRALKEDIGQGDVTTDLFIPAKKIIKAVILAKARGIVCGLDVARLVFMTVDKKIHFQALIGEGKRVNRGEIIVRLKGEARNILKAERVALNFLSRLSGIATKTFQYIQRIKPYKVKIMDTRKTTPGLRILEKYAVHCAGGFNHRMGLWDQILVKDNHLYVLRDVSCVGGKKDLQEIMREIKLKKPKGLKIEVEVKNLQEFKKALLLGVDIIMLDNFNLKNIREAVKMRNAIRNTQYAIPKLEVSGGVNIDNVRRIAACGVEMISIGKLTHSVKALDVSLNCE